MSSESAVPGSRPLRGEERMRVILCQYCGYDTDRKNNLKRHVHTMHEASPVELDCCGQRFFSKAELRAHTRQMHRHGYMCPVCRHVFCRKALLRRHLSVHTGIKDFICSVCKYDTSHKSNLERHLRSHLKNPDLAAAAQKALADLEASRSSTASESVSSTSQPAGASSNELQDRSSNTSDPSQWPWPWTLHPRHLHSPPPPPLLPCPPETTLQPVRQPCPRRGFTIEALLQTDESSSDTSSSGAPQGKFMSLTTLSQASPHEYSEPVSSPEAADSSASSSTSSPGRVSGPEEQGEARGQEYVHKKLRFSRKLRHDEASLCADRHETSRL
ncbi:early growth response protein 1-like [Eriocheir sinensis]|uniref:early growth response protein 1-like n=1 Tax=Eriocheir sinensis TaxID=95602 RepID=UPI0021C78A6B|nr:early growth response protein 1-like [Eriocheir sinensis]